MAAFERDKSCDSKVVVIVFIVVLTGMGARPFTAGFLNKLFYHEEHNVGRLVINENRNGLSCKFLNRTEFV